MLRAGCTLTPDKLVRAEIRPLLSDTGGGGGQIGPPGFWLTHPPTHITKFFLMKKMKFIKGARTWRSILGTQTFFWPLTPPPPRYSINQPLSKGLVVMRGVKGDQVVDLRPTSEWVRGA